MNLDVLQAKALCYAYMGQRIGDHGLLRKEFEDYCQKALGKLEILEQLAELKLLVEVDSERTRIEKANKDLSDEITFKKKEAAIRARTFRPRRSYSTFYGDPSNKYEIQAKHEFQAEPDFIKVSILGEQKAKMIIQELLAASNLVAKFAQIPNVF